MSNHHISLSFKPNPRDTLLHIQRGRRQRDAFVPEYAKDALRDSVGSLSTAALSGVYIPKGRHTHQIPEACMRLTKAAKVVTIDHTRNPFVLGLPVDWVIFGTHTLQEVRDVLENPEKMYDHGHGILVDNRHAGLLLGLFPEHNSVLRESMPDIRNGFHTIPQNLVIDVMDYADGLWEFDASDTLITDQKVLDTYTALRRKAGVTWQIPEDILVDEQRCRMLTDLASFERSRREVLGHHAKLMRFMQEQGT